MASGSNSHVNNINDLLNDKLYQVIGSTPKSVAESLMKIDLKNKPKQGVEIFAIACFAAAVNKSTLETFLADQRFANVRPSLTATMSINGRANMTALTLLGHCLLTTDQASSVNFTAEFRKKMGQNHLWDGELLSGSLSDKQKEILKEKKRLTDVTSAKALGSGFMKICGIVSEPMDKIESDLFNLEISANTAEEQGGATAFSVTGNESTSDARPTVGTSRLTVSRNSIMNIPDDVLKYRREVLRHDESRILESLERHGQDKFISDTRTMMISDPNGDRARRAGTTIGSR